MVWMVRPGSCILSPGQVLHGGMHASNLHDRSRCDVGSRAPFPPEVDAQVTPPERRCADLLACEYGEIHQAYAHKFESGCGANCSGSFWVRDRETGQVYVESGGVRSAILGAKDISGRPDVRVIAPHHQSGNPRCCPSAVRDVLYTWSSSQNTVVSADERLIGVRELDWDRVKQSLRDEGYILYFD